MEMIFENEQSAFEDLQGIEGLMRAAALKCLEAEGVRQDVEISVLLVDDEGIQEINREHRGKDQPTDVLSFPQYEEIAEIGKDPHPVLGDIVLSLERAAGQAVEYGHSFEREVGFLTVHSMLHLLGYDHDTPERTAAMRQREETILAALDLVRD